MASLDVDAVKAFLAIAEHRSFTLAAQVLDSTQGALSVKLKRLEDRLGQRLIERTPRVVRLSVQGASFIEVAREFVAAHDRAIASFRIQARRLLLGLAAQVGSAELPRILSKLHESHPAVAVETRMGNSRELLDALDRGELDMAIVRGGDDRRDGHVLTTEEFGWYAAPGFVYRSGEPLRLAASSPSCGIREGATKALDAAGVRWTQTYLGCGAFGVAEAVTAGLAAAVFSRRLVPAGAEEIGPRYGLPALPPSDIVLHSALSDAGSRRMMKAIASAFRGGEVRPLVVARDAVEPIQSRQRAA